MVSASEACAYVANLFPPGELNLSISTIALLYLCALLNFWGIRESAKIALVIFTVSTPAPLPAPPAVRRPVVKPMAVVAKPPPAAAKVSAVEVIRGVQKADFEF